MHVVDEVGAAQIGVGLGLCEGEPVRVPREQAVAARPLFDGLLRMTSSPKGETSNSPEAWSRATISCIGFERAFLSMAQTPMRMTGRPDWSPPRRGSFFEKSFFWQGSKLRKKKERNENERNQ